MLDEIKKLQIENKKSNRITVTALGFALIAVTVPILIDLLFVPNYGKWIISFIYFTIGLFIIFEQWYKMEKEK